MICLAYHRILDRMDGDHRSVSTDHFCDHLALLRKSRLPILDPARFAPGGNADGILLTFDDGTADHFATVRPLLREFGMKAIFYVPTARLGHPGCITPDELQQLHEDGHMIGSHSHTHARLTEVSYSQLAHELECSAAHLHQLLAARPSHFAPPGGLYDSSVRNVAIRAGYRYFRTMDWGYNRRFDPMRIEVVPMTDAWGNFFLSRALSGSSEWPFKFAWRAKRMFRSAQMR